MWDGTQLDGHNSPSTGSKQTSVILTAVNLEVSKTANPALTRTFEWDIEKDVDPDTHNLEVGSSGTSEYTVVVTQTGSTDSDHAVSGTITIHNPAQFAAANITAVTDEFNGTTATVDCGVTIPHSLAAGETLNCTYTGTATGLETENEVTVTTDGDVGGGSATAPINWAAATVTNVNDTVNVEDAFDGGTAVELDGSPISDTHTFTYERTFSCGSGPGTVVTPGTHQFPNIATIVQTGQNDDAEVTVICEEPPEEFFAGCTPGFWKNNGQAVEDAGHLATLSLSDNYWDTVGVDFGAHDMDDLLRQGRQAIPDAELTIEEALDLGGGNLRALIRHSAAALLNAESLGTDYPFSISDIETLVQEAFENEDANWNNALSDLEEANELGCGFNAHGEPIDPETGELL